MGIRAIAVTAVQSVRLPNALEKRARVADRLACEAWNQRMPGFSRAEAARHSVDAADGAGPPSGAAFARKKIHAKRSSPSCRFGI